MQFNPDLQVMRQEVERGCPDCIVLPCCEGYVLYFASKSIGENADFPEGHIRVYLYTRGSEFFYQKDFYRA